MEINNNNFITLQNDIKQYIRNCDFISVNSQLSGRSGEKTLTISDSPIMHQENIINNVQKLGLLQVGISIWTRVENAEDKDRDKTVDKKDTSKMRVSSYNFYINPFLTQAGKGRSIRFENDLMQELRNSIQRDWNRTIKRGLPQLDPEDYKTARDDRNYLLRYLTTKSQYPETKQLETKDKEAMFAIIESLNKAAMTAKPIEDLPFQVKQVPLFIQHHLANQVKNNHWGQYYLYIQEEKWHLLDDAIQKLRLYKFDDQAAFDHHVLSIKNRIKSKYIEMVGVTEIFENIVSSRKVVVGQDMLFDTMFLQNCFRNKLPKSLFEFKQNVCNCDLNIQDIATVLDCPSIQEQFRTVDIDKVYKKIIEVQFVDFQHPQIVNETTNNNYLNCGQYSFIQGHVFCKLRKYYDIKINEMFVNNFKNILQLKNSLQKVNLQSDLDSFKQEDKSRLQQVLIHDFDSTMANDHLQKQFNLEDDQEINQDANIVEKNKFNIAKEVFLYLSSRDSVSMANKIPQSKYKVIKWEDYILQFEQ